MTANVFVTASRAGETSIGPSTRRNCGAASSTPDVCSMRGRDRQFHARCDMPHRWRSAACNSSPPHEMNGAMSLLLIGAAMFASATACTNAQGDTREPASAKAPVTANAAAPARTELSPEEKRFYRDVAKSAWAYMDANYQPATGLVSATADWPNTTIWDIGGQLLAFRAAKDLGLLAPDEFDKRIRKALSTLEKAPLYNKVAYNKVISTTTGGLGEGGVHGYAATDLGRLLAALKIISVQEPQLKDQIQRVVGRIDMKQIVKD